MIYLNSYTLKMFVFVIGSQTCVQYQILFKEVSSKHYKFFDIVFHLEFLLILWSCQWFAIEVIVWQFETCHERTP